MVDERLEGEVAVAGEDAAGVAGQLAGGIEQVAELAVQQILAGEVSEVFGLAGAGEEVEGIQADAQVRAAGLSNEGGARLQVVAEDAGSLKLQCGSQAALAAFLSRLNQ